MTKLTPSPLLLAGLAILLIAAAACAPIPPPTAAPTTAPAVAPTAAPSNSITDIVWQWTSVANKTTGETTTVSTPEKYTITFRADGTLSGKADCNTFKGTYSQASGFSMTVTPDVMAACGGDSLDQQYIGLLKDIVAGGPDGSGGLALETAGGEQRMCSRTAARPRQPRQRRLRRRATRSPTSSGSGRASPTRRPVRRRP